MKQGNSLFQHAGKEDFFVYLENKEEKYGVFTKEYWRLAARQFGDVRMITIAALIVALRIAVKMFRVPLAAGLSITFDAYVNSLGSVIYGPLVGLMVGFVSDILGLVAVGRVGEYFPPFTLVEMASSFIFALFFWRKKITFSRALTAKFSVNFICNIIMTSAFEKWRIAVMSGAEAAEKYNIINGVRIAKNLILFPLEATLIIIVLSAALPVLAKFKLLDKDHGSVDKPTRVKLISQIVFFMALSVALVLLYVFFLKDFIKELNIKFW